MAQENAVSIFCDNIQHLRKHQGLTKKEMAQKLGISVKTLTIIESGKLPPRLNCDVLFRAEESFHIAPQSLLMKNFGKNKMGSPPSGRASVPSRCFRHNCGGSKPPPYNRIINSFARRRRISCSRREHIAGICHYMVYAYIANSIGIHIAFYGSSETAEPYRRGGVSPPAIPGVIAHKRFVGNRRTLP